MRLPAEQHEPTETPDLTGAEFSARAARFLVLVAADLAALALAGAAGYLLWAGPVRNISVTRYYELSPLLLLFVAGYAQAGLYPGFGLGPVETLRRLTRVTTFGFLLLASISFALKLEPVYSRVSFVLAFAAASILVPGARALAVRLAGRSRWWREPVVVIGSGERAIDAARTLAANAHAGYRPAATIAEYPRAVAAGAHGVPAIGGLEQLEWLAARGVRVALLEATAGQEAAVLDRVQQHFHRVVVLRPEQDVPIEGVQVRNMAGVVGIEYTNNLLVRENRAIKRALDIVLASMAAIVAMPIAVVAALLVRMIDGGPVLFFQERVGLDGRRIAVPKIRTMKLDAEQRLAGHLAANPVMKDEWKRRYKIRNDPRLIPGIGRPFRRLSIDELPQLWSVLKGEMSLVGPRPFPPYHLERFAKDFLDVRQRVHPGITGLWQVTVRGDGSVSEQQRYDSYYIRNWSVWMDLYILARTLATVLSGRGAY